jgi:hypothetical protein
LPAASVLRFHRPSYPAAHCFLTRAAFHNDSPPKASASSSPDMKTIAEMLSENQATRCGAKDFAQLKETLP